MKILHIANYFSPLPEAAAVIESKIAEYLANYGHEIIVLIPKELTNSRQLKQFKRKKKPSNFLLYRSSSFFRYPFSFIFSHFENIIKFFIKLKKNFTPDLILSQFHPHHYASVAGGYISRILKIPHIIRSHDLFIMDKNQGPLFYQLYNLIVYPPIHKSISNCRIFYASTTEMQRYLYKFHKFKDMNIRVSYNGVDIERFYPYNNQESLKDEFGCNTILSFIGLVHKNYGFHNFLHALPNIFKYNKDTHFILVGFGPDMNYVLNFVKKNNLTKQFHYLGVKPNDQIPFYINNSDIGIVRFTQTKYVQYCIPYKCLEYMACQKPFITTPISKDVIYKNDTGIVLRGDYKEKELIDNLIMLIEDKNLREKLGKNGLTKVYQKFKWEVIIDKINNDILNLLN